MGGGTFGGEGFAGGCEGAAFTGAGGGPNRSFGMLPRLGIARATEPRGVPFRGAFVPLIGELPWPFPLAAMLCSALTFLLGKSSFGEASSRP